MSNYSNEIKCGYINEINSYRQEALQELKDAIKCKFNVTITIKAIYDKYIWRDNLIEKGGMLFQNINESFCEYTIENEHNILDDTKRDIDDFINEWLIDAYNNYYGYLSESDVAKIDCHVDNLEEKAEAYNI